MQLVYADNCGNVYDHPDFIALGRNGDMVTEIMEEELIPLPAGATLVSLPDTRPLAMDAVTKQMCVVPGDVTAVGALLPQGHTRLLLPGYMKRDKTKLFPLFGYTAVVWKDGQFYVAAHQTDDPEPWDPSHCDIEELELKVSQLSKKYAENRLVQHLSKCALEYECMTASNTFLSRWEGAVPVSSSCNAGCYGCISEQPDDSGFPSPQTRMNFRPTVQEVVEVMMEHLTSNRRIISFGQGCEGEPSVQAPVISEAIKEVRRLTKQGFININTNAGLTRSIISIVDAGLDLMRVSMISAIPEHYNAYYRPRGYTLSDVEQSLRYAADHGVVTSINYLVFPGVTDREEEMEAMIEFVRRNDVKLIQFRNLNIDPESYLQLIPPAKGEQYGMKQMLDIYAEQLPGVRLGSYTHVPGDWVK